ncbi:NECAP-like protein CG9132 [Hetaerina americana]|uniref:NECAP-like protein CG9132 n=1 Tax=Hetaerina americana TaxID=62018 RepID=UPI003A7F29A2
MDSYESVLLVKSEVFVFKIPPRTTSRGHRAADWNLQEPDWTGRLRLVSKGKECILKLEDKNTGELFAKCPIEQYPGVAVEAVTDSSRYFVLRIQDDNGRSAFIGVGFSDRSDSFDLNVALQDHFKWVKKSQEIEKEKEEPKQELDLRFKEGETIKINMKITKKDGSEVSSRPKARNAAGSGILPPPPGGMKIAPPPGGMRVTPTSSPSHGSQRPIGGPSSNVDLLLDVGGSSSQQGGASVAQAPTKQATSTNEMWGEFASASQPSAAAAPPPPGNSSWVQF